MKYFIFGQNWIYYFPVSTVSLSDDSKLAIPTPLLKARNYQYLF